ncbi:response regulator receiver modulated serine phosphatase [Actinobacteria bacterium OK074]|nr:response regulator receiver modulated serine phosphatase [Actinobacteria bacterium OK074]
MDRNGKQTDATARTDSTVLVVDDVPASRYALGAVLSRAGHRVVPVASAGEALGELDLRLRTGTLPDVALVDVGLPDMDGFELCRRLKSQGPTAALPVVHFSAASVAPVDRCRGLDSGGEAYLTVPAEPEEIQAVVRAALRGARLRNGAEVLVGRLNLLSEAIVAVQTARTPQELASAAAEGTARLTGSPAAVFVLGEDGELHSALSPHRAPTLLPDAAAHEAVARAIRGIAADGRGVLGEVGAPGGELGGALGAGAVGGGGDVVGAVVPAGLWPPGFFRVGSAADAAYAVVSRIPQGKAAVCLAVSVRSEPVRPGTAANGAAREGSSGTADGPGSLPPQSDTLVERLAHATALAAEPLLKYQAERHVALTLQHSFLPRPEDLPTVPGAEIVVRYVPASRQTEIGGDFYTVLRTPVGLLTGVGDVVGHSLDAATVMVEIRHALRAYCVEDPDPAVLVRRLDRMLQHYHPDITATVCLVLVDPDRGRVRIANAGHIPPLLIHSDGTAKYAKAAGPLLGLGLPRPRATDNVLLPSDRLLMITDGLIETRGTDLTVSMEQLRTVAAGGPADIGALCDTLLTCFGQNPQDDIALLGLRLR